MKVAIIQNVTLNDHRSVHSHNIARELQNRGYTVDVILQKTEEELQFTEQPYRLIQLPGKTYSVSGQIAFMKALPPILKRENYHIIHAKNPFSSVLIPIFLKKVNIVTSHVIYDIRGLWVDFGVHSHQFPPVLRPVLNGIDHILMHQCDHVIAISRELEGILLKRGIPADRITTIIGSGVNIEDIAQIPSKDIKQMYNIQGTVIGYIGTISASRQSDKLIKAFQHIRKHYKDCYLVLVGPEDGSVHNLITNTQNVIHLGYVPHQKAISLLKSFDLAVAYHDVEIPIFNVAVPIKVLEYMAAGVPVIATDHPMYQNILVHKKTGFLTQQNIHSFCQGVCTLLDDATLQKSLVEHAYKAVTQYSIKSLVDTLESIYHSE
jgi:glycosyltransferase involved in cell wall biosynthesis